MKTPYEIATQTRDILVKRGWVQCAWSADDGCCLLGAVGLAASQDVLDASERAPAVVVALVDEIGRDWAPEFDCDEDVITSWNDEDGRTKEQVLELLDRTAKRLDPQAGLDGPARIYEAEPVKTTPAPQEEPSENDTPAEPAEKPQEEPVPA